MRASRSGFASAGGATWACRRRRDGLWRTTAGSISASEGDFRPQPWNVLLWPSTVAGVGAPCCPLLQMCMGKALAGAWAALVVVPFVLSCLHIMPS